MAKICDRASHPDLKEHYEGVAQNYIQQWQALAVSNDKSHLLMTYGNETSNGLLYNLYADLLLQLHIVPDEVYDLIRLKYTF